MFHLDLLTRLGQALTFADLEVVRMPFEELTVSVVSPRTLCRMKRNTVLRCAACRRADSNLACPVSAASPSWKPRLNRPGPR